MKRRGTFIGYGLLVLGAVSLFQMKYQIEAKERLLQDLQKQYISDQRSLRVLNAEWAYLNSPAYLQELAGKYLKLGPTPPYNILSSPTLLPWRDPGSGKVTPKPDAVTKPLAPAAKRNRGTLPAAALQPASGTHFSLKDEEGG